MDTEIIIKKRVSVRKFQKKAVPTALVNKIMEAARLAPSAYNAQPWRFVVVSSLQVKQILRENNIFKQSFVCEAPLIIVCSADPDVFPKERFESTYSDATEIGGNIGAVRDLSISAQNLVLAAYNNGLGACYIGLLDRKKIKELLNIPKNYVIPFVIILGYPAEKPGHTARKELKGIMRIV
jgi:nitroreductase